MYVRHWLSYQKINHNLNVQAFELGKSLSPEWAVRKDLRSAALCFLYFKLRNEHHEPWPFQKGIELNSFKQETRVWYSTLR